MITFRITSPDFGRVTALVARMKPAGRAQLNNVAANAVASAVQRHIHRYAAGKHFSAASLGARPTGHYEKGAAAITASSSADGAEVVIPIPGISRAFHPVDIATPTINGKNYLTIPKHPDAYGQTVSKLRLRGWTIFRPGKKKCLLGYRRKGDKPVLLFSLAESVHQKKDPSLLPAQAELGNIFANAQKRELLRVLRKAAR